MLATVPVTDSNLQNHEVHGFLPDRIQIQPTYKGHANIVVVKSRVSSREKMILRCIDGNLKSWSSRVLYSDRDQRHLGCFLLHPLIAVGA